MRTNIKRFTKWFFIGLLGLSFAILIATHPVTSQYVKQFAIASFIIFASLALYIIDRNLINKMWRGFLEELSKNKEDIEWLIEKRDSLLNTQHTNIFRKGVLGRMYNRCQEEIEALENKKNYSHITLQQNEYIKKLEEQIKDLDKKSSSLNDTLNRIDTVITISEEKGILIDFLKIIDAMRLKQFFIKADNSKLNKKEIFEIFAKTLSFKPENTEESLSESYNNTSIENNLLIFDELKETSQKEINRRLSNKNK